jgi:hypothetical protein
MAEDKNKKESLTSDFSALLDAVKSEAEAKKADTSSRELQGRLSTVMAEKGHDLQGQALKEMQDLQALLAGNKFDDIEAQKEANAVAEETLKRLGEISENTEASGEEKLEGIGLFAGIVGAIAVGLAGFISGFILGITDAVVAFTKGLGRALKALVPQFAKNAFKNNITKPLTEFFKRFKAAFTMGTKGLKTFKAGILMTTANFFGRVTRAFIIKKNVFMNATKAIRGSITNLFAQIMRPFKAIGRGFTSLGTFVIDGFKGAGDALRSIGKTLGVVGDTTKATAKGAGTISKTIKTLGSFFKQVFTVFKGIGSVLGRLFLPLTILMTAVDTIKGAIDGFTKQEGGLAAKVFAGVIGGIKGAVVGLIGIPLDLLKSGVAFIAGKLGFENFSETLASFSIAELIGSMFDKIKNTVLGFFDAMKDETGSFDFGKIIKVLVGTIFNTLTAPIRLLLEGLAKLAEKIPFKGDDIAAGIRSFKGKLTMDTGVDEAIQNVENKAAASEQGENLNKASTELKSEERAASTTTADIVNAVTSSNTSNRAGDTIIVGNMNAPDAIAEGLSNR